MRTLPGKKAVFALFLLAGCDGGAPQPAPSAGVAPAERLPRIACAREGEALETACTVERASDADGVVLTLRHPDGGFRRLRASTDGSITAADGAETARVREIDGVTREIAVGDARYRMATSLLRP